MKSIKEKAEEYAPYTKDDSWHRIRAAINAQTSFEVGANYVLDAIKNYINNIDLGNSAEEKFYKLDVIADIGLFIEQLKK
jgi:hypothetical protein